MRAAILVTGNEVLRGVIQERNAGLLARSLDVRGASVERVLIVGDDQPALVAALRELLGLGVDLVCTSGGLGPTHDDLTMAAVAEVTGRPLCVDPSALELVAARSMPVAQTGISAETRRTVQEKQASLPEGAVLLPPVGTAPGCVVGHGHALVAVLPGPPWELQEMWERATEEGPVADLLERGGGGQRRMLRLFGVVESQFVEALGGVDPEVLGAVELGVCARAAELEISIRAPEASAAAVDALEAALEDAFGDALYSRDGRTVEAVVADALRARSTTVAVAESCTGGLLGGRLTAAPGASAYVRGGVIAYDDDLKVALLGVPRDLIARHGAVSAEVAVAMAAGARRAAGSDWALSVTGIAGPGGGSPQKPVGLVYIGLAGPGGADASRHLFRGDRARVRERSVAFALHRLRVGLAGLDDATES